MRMVKILATYRIKAVILRTKLAIPAILLRCSNPAVSIAKPTVASSPIYFNAY